MIIEGEGLNKYFDYLEDQFNLNNNYKNESKTENKEPNKNNQNLLNKFSQSEKNPKKNPSGNISKEKKDKNPKEEDYDELNYFNDNGDDRAEFYLDFDISKVEVNDSHLSYQYSENQREEDFHTEYKKMSFTEVAKDNIKKK